MKLLFISAALILVLTACGSNSEHYMLDGGETIILGNAIECVEGDCTDPSLEPLIDYADPEPTEEQIADADVVEETNQETVDAIDAANEDGVTDETVDSDVADETGPHFHGVPLQPFLHNLDAISFHPLQAGN